MENDSILCDGTMDKVFFRKIQLGADLLVCSVWLLLSLHNCPNVPILFFYGLLRVWASFLLYRRSTMAIYPIVMLTIAGCLICLGLTDTPEFVLDVVKIISSLFGGDGRMLVHQIRYGAEGGGWYVEAIRSIVYWFVFLWLALSLDVWIRYIYLWIRKQLVKSSWSMRRSLLLCLYLIVLLIVASVGCEGLLFQDYNQVARDFFGLFVFLSGIFALPYLFREVDFKHLLTRGEWSYILLMLVLVMCYSSGCSITQQAMMAVLTLPSVCYLVFNYSCSRKPSRHELVLIVLACTIFWGAQYAMNMWRVMLLLLSVGVIGVVTVRFVSATRRKWRGLILFLFTAFIVPISSLGYNPYSAMGTARLRDFSDYIYGNRGLLYVYDNDGVGIRDRYGMIMPADFCEIDFVQNWKPYTRARDVRHKWNPSWRLYDIERQEFITDEYYERIELCDENVMRLQIDSCTNRFMTFDWWYDRFSDREHYVITDTMPKNLRR